jgi:N-acetylated-alpha-linked acidic dipeptidase
MHGVWITAVALALTSLPMREWISAPHPAPSAAPASIEPSDITARLSAWHDLLAAEPHMAGTEGDARVIESIATAFREMGMEVEVHPFWAYLPRPREPIVEIVATPGDAPLVEPIEAAPAEPGNAPSAGSARGGQLGSDSTNGAAAPRARRGVMRLAVREENLAIDPQLAHAGLTFAWNAYSGRGDVTGEVVYVNHGTRADFAKLRDAGVDLRGKICLARYGGNFRGYKAKFAEDAGAIGLIIFTDPGDSGPAKGAVWPDGGWANASCIQRGSINTLPYSGDPLTPGREATEHAERLDVAEVDLPRIPVQPIGWGAAREIVRRMRGEPLIDPTWATGFEGPTLLTGGPDLRVRLAVAHEPAIVKTANVIARLPGRAPDGRMVIVGCHHDAWGFGAADPLAGTIVLMEAAHECARRAKEGQGPARDTLFCAWGAEEFGIVGSSEWVERECTTLQERGVAYINLDMAAMGVNFGVSASPSLRGIVDRVARRVPSAVDPSRTVFEATAKDGVLGMGDLGGGSDHQPFLCHAGVPSIGLTAGGSQGTSYHSNYDTLAWYRRTVGTDYTGAAMLTGMTVGLVDALGTQAREPWRDADAAARALRSAAPKMGPLLERRALDLADRFEAQSRAMQVQPAIDPVLIQQLIQAWLDPTGLEGRPWFRNTLAASDRDSGYAAWVLPGLQAALADQDPAATDRALTQLEAVANRIASTMGDSNKSSPAAAPR